VRGREEGVAVYTSAELADLQRCDRKRLQATVEQLETLTVAVDLLKITSGREGLEAIRSALHHRLEQLKPEHDRASCSTCRGIDQVPR